MPWIALTAESLKTKLSKPELEKIPGAAKAAGLTSDEVMAKAVSDMVREVRGFVAVKNPLGPAGTIPDELEKAALALIRRDLFTRLPGLADLFDETRKAEASYAERNLARVAKGEFVIVPPTELAPSDEQPGGGGLEIVSSREDRVGGGRLDRL